MTGGAGRPLRFLGLVLTGWIGLRVFLLWPANPGELTVPELLRALSPVPLPAAAAPPLTVEERIDISPWVPATSVRTEPAVVAPQSLGMTERAAFAMAALARFGAVAAAGEAHGVTTPFVPQADPGFGAPVPLATDAADRWSASAWLLTRGGGSGAAGSGRLGDGQAGAVVRRAVAGQGAFGVYGRVTSPLEGAGREAAVGVDWRPVATVPVWLLAERRVGLDGVPDGFAVGATGGIGPVPTVTGLSVEAYGQAGAVRRGGDTQPFVDTLVRAAAPVAKRGTATVDLGIAGWGAAQQDVHRVDIGPSVALRLPRLGRGSRLQLDWRERVAGRASPGSGPALTLAADF